MCRARDGVGAASTLALLDQIALDRQALTDLKSTPLSIAAPADGHVSGLAVQAGAKSPAPTWCCMSSTTEGCGSPCRSPRPIEA